MAFIFPSRTLLAPVPYMVRVRNGVEPDYRTGQQIALRHAKILAFHRKHVFSKHVRFQNLPQGQASTVTQWRWLCRTGNAAGTVSLVARLGLLPGSNSAGTDPKVRMVVYDGTTTTNSDWRSYFTSSSLTPGLNDISWTEVTIDGLDADTVYQCHIETVDYCRIACATVYEQVVPYLLDSADYVTDAVYSDGADIYDDDHSELVTNGHVYWKHNGAHLGNVVPEWPGSGKFTTTSTTWVNMLGGSTTPSASTAGLTLPVRHHSPVHSNNVACVVGVYGYVSATSGGDLRLIDTNTTTLATISSFTTTPAWHTATLNLDGSAASHKVDVHFQAPYGETLTVEAVSLYEYVT